MTTRQWWMTAMFVCAVVVVTAGANGGERSNVRAMGMARTGVATSRGLDAVGLNPANLAYKDDGTVTLSLVPFGVQVGSDFLTYGLYNEYFTGTATSNGRVGQYLTAADKETILNAFPGGVGVIDADLEVRPIGISVRPSESWMVTFTMTEHAAAYFQIPQEYLRFVFFGNTPGSVYDFSATKAKAAWTRDYAVSFGMEVPELSFLQSMAAGISVKMVQGFGYYEIQNFNTRLVTGADGILRGDVGVTTRVAGIDPIRRSDGGNFTPFPVPAGKGWGVDLGIGGRVNDYLSFGISVTDIGSITWTRNVEVYTAGADSTIVVDNPTDEAQRKDIENKVKGTPHDGGSFSTLLPTRFRAGVAVDLQKLPWVKRILLGEMTLSMDYAVGLADAPGSSTRSRVSAGLEYRPWGVIALRTGIAIGGNDRSNFALGLGLHFVVFDLDVASDNLNWLVAPNSFSYGSVALGMKIRI